MWKVSSWTVEGPDSEYKYTVHYHGGSAIKAIITAVQVKPYSQDRVVMIEWA
jgi:hypothetical protein